MLNEPSFAIIIVRMLRRSDTLQSLNSTRSAQQGSPSQRECVGGGPGFEVVKLLGLKWLLTNRYSHTVSVSPIATRTRRAVARVPLALDEVRVLDQVLVKNYRESPADPGCSVAAVAFPPRTQPAPGVSTCGWALLSRLM